MVYDRAVMLFQTLQLDYVLGRRGKGEASFLLCKSPEREKEDVMKRDEE